MPRLMWASTKSGLSRKASRYSAIASSSFPCSQGDAEVDVGPREVGPEPQRRRGYSAIASSCFPCDEQGEAEIIVGVGSAGLPPDLRAQGRDRLVEDVLRLPGPTTIFQHLAQADEVPPILRPQSRQVLEDGDRLVRLPFCSRAWASSCAVSGRSDRAAV